MVFIGKNCLGSDKYYLFEGSQAPETQKMGYRRWGAVKSGKVKSSKVKG
jgi:hypothetical protein